MSPIDVETNRFGNARVGANLQETLLNASNVNSHQFGRLFNREVDGDIYAQPLVVSGVRIGNAQPNVVYVATANNSVFAFDADNPAQAAPYWQLGPQRLGEPVPRRDVGPRIPPYHDFAKTIGITSTPVADKASGTLFFEVKSKRNGAYFHHLHAVDLATGAAKNGSPKEIAASVPGTARDGNGQTVTFGALRQLNRPGLLLMNGVLYVAYGSHGDHGLAANPNDVTYHGWVLAYRADTLAQIAAYCVSPDGNQGGIWQSGNGLTGEDGFVYCVAGNGQGTVTARNLGNSVIKLGLDPAGANLQLAGSFTPGNVQFLDANDLDLSSGAVLVPDGRQLVACSKEGRCYVLDRDSMALIADFLASVLIVQPPPEQRNPPESNIHAAPVFWISEAHGLVLYVWGENDYLRAWRRNGAGFSFLAHSPMHAPPGMPGGMLTLSANGSTTGSGIIWAAHPYTQDANRNSVDGILRAFDADDITRELWNSKQDAQRDDVGKFAKFNPPTVANGKVYLATFANPAGPSKNSLAVYGQLPGVPPPPPSPWNQADIGTPLVGSFSGGSGRFVVTGAGDDIEGTADSFHFAFQELRGNCRVQARVRSVADTNEWAKAGVMIRQTLTPESPHAMVVVTPKHGVVFQWRTAVGQPLQTAFGPQIAAPWWVRVDRSADTFTGFVSADGQAWVQIGAAQQIPLGSDDLLGLAVTSHNGSLQDPLPMNNSVFDSLTIQTVP